MTRRYAQGTRVSVDRSRDEIETILRRFGAENIATMTNPKATAIVFEFMGRTVRFIILLPKPGDLHTPTGRKPRDEKKAIDAERRRRYRSLANSIKAKLDSVTSELTIEERQDKFQREFLAYTVMPDGHTVYELLGPRIAEAYASGQMPDLGRLLLPPADPGHVIDQD